MDSPSGRPAYPSVVSVQALAELSADPRTPPIVAPFLVALAANFPTATEDAHLAPVQTAYDHALQLRQEPQTGAHSLTARALKPAS